MTQRQVGARAIPLGHVDRNPQRARIDHSVRAALNDQIGVTIEVMAPAVADTEFAVLHPALGHKTQEFEIVSQDQPGRLYASSRSRWTNRVSYFRYDKAGGRLRIRLR